MEELEGLLVYIALIGFLVWGVPLWSWVSTIRHLHRQTRALRRIEWLLEQERKERKSAATKG